MANRLSVTEMPTSLRVTASSGRVHEKQYGKAQSMDNQPDKYEDLTSYWGQFVDTLMGKVKDVI